MVYVVMGVAGCGKTTAGTLLAERISARFVDADDYHTESSISKMKRGIPLDDDDRRQWLETLSAIVREHISAGKPLVLACSALKQRYRDTLVGDNAASITFIYLKCDINTVKQRVSSRQNHFMPASLIESQFADLEEPVGDNVIVVDDIKTASALMPGIF